LNAPTSDAKTIFGRAIDIEDAAAREAYLDQACGPNDQLRAEIDSLVHAHFKVGDFLKGPARDAATCLHGADAGEEGMVIGPYKLLERIGEAAAAGQWLQARLERLLPVEHFRAARPAISTVFCNERKSTPIAGMAHHLVARCPASDSHHVSGTPFESQKLVESGTLRLRNVFRCGLAPCGLMRFSPCVTASQFALPVFA
jgi:hypothetical protein